MLLSRLHPARNINSGMQTNSVLDESLNELEHRLDRLEFMLGSHTTAEPSLSCKVDALVRDVAELFAENPQAARLVQLIQSHHLSKAFEPQYPLSVLYDMNEARLSELSAAIAQLTQLRDLTLPEPAPVIPPNPRDLPSVIAAFEDASVRSAELLATWLRTVQWANLIGGEAESHVRQRLKPDQLRSST